MDDGKHDPVEPWSGTPTVMALLHTILQGKSAELAAVNVQLPEGGLRDAHVCELVDLIDKRRKKARFSIDYALHAMLFHVLGGSDAKLLMPPPKVNETSIALGKYTRAHCEAYTSQRKNLKGETRRVADHLQDGHARRIEQHRLSTELLDQLVVRLRGDPRVVAAAGGGGGDGVPEELSRLEERNRIGMLLLLGSTPYAGNISPLVALYNFQPDIIKYIADLAALDHPEWVPRPQPREVRALRKLAWEQDLELRTLRAAVEEIRLTAVEAETERRRALSREEAARHAADASRTIARAALADMTVEYETRLKQLERKYHGQLREKQREWDEDATEWQLYLNRQEKAWVAQLREQDDYIRPLNVSLAQARDEVKQHAAEVEKRLEQIKASLERVRCSSKAGLIEQVAELQTKVQELGARRKANQRKIGDCNLDKTRTANARAEVDRFKSVIADNWDRGTFELAEQAAALKEQVARVEGELDVMRENVKALEQSEVRLGAVVAPPPPMERGHYGARIRFMIMKLVAMANACPTRISLVYKIVSDYHGIILPSRDRAVLVSKASGVATYKKTYLQWIPSETTCLRIRTEMGVFSQLQVGEYIIENGGTAGNFGIHSDAASSDGTELSAFVIGHRYTADNGASKVRNLLLDLNWAMDKTSATHPSDLRAACMGVARLCEKAGMEITKLISELIPSASMNDRASPERLAAKMMTQSETDGPTCGEHGALVNPMHHAAKAMDMIVRGWMGKTEAELALDADKSRALHMAVGWHSSPCGAVIYCTTKYGALNSDKGYAVGQKYVGYRAWCKERGLEGDAEMMDLLGHMEDLLSIKGSRAYVTSINAPIVERLLQQIPGSFYTFLKETEEIAAGKDGGKIRKQILAGAESPEIMACVRAEAILGDFYMWPLLRAIKYRPPDGSDPHILDMAPIYQEAHVQLLTYAETPRLVATGQATLLPSYPHFYVTHTAGRKTKGSRAAADMKRIYEVAISCERILELLTAALKALADELFNHTREFQVGGCLTGENDTPELRAKLSGINRTNTVVECVFALEKILCTREKGSLLRGRKGWTLFKYNGTDVWGETLDSGKLKLYMDVARVEGYAIAKSDGNRQEQLKRSYEHTAKEREAKLEAVREKHRAAAAELLRLSDPALRAKTFSALKQLSVDRLKEQLKLRAVVDKRREANGKALIRTPPKKDGEGEGGRAWLILKLQSLLRSEFNEGLLSTDPNDLSEGDSGCGAVMRAANAKAPKAKVPKAKASRAGEAKATRPRVQQQQQQAAQSGESDDESDEENDDESDDESDVYKVEAILDQRYSDAADNRRMGWAVGTVLFLVAWQGWTAEWNTWEPARNIEPSLITDYEERQQAADADDEDMLLALCLSPEASPEIADPSLAATEEGVEVSRLRWSNSQCRRS